jgi:hypothetical protein
MVVFIETIPKASLDATEADITDSPDTAHVSAGLDLNKAGVGLDRQVPMGLDDLNVSLIDGG